MRLRNRCPTARRPAPATPSQSGSRPARRARRTRPLSGGSACLPRKLRCDRRWQPLRRSWIRAWRCWRRRQRATRPGRRSTWRRWGPWLPACSAASWWARGRPGTPLLPWHGACLGLYSQRRRQWPRPCAWLHCRTPQATLPRRSMQHIQQCSTCLPCCQQPLLVVSRCRGPPGLSCSPSYRRCWGARGTPSCTTRPWRWWRCT
mmetsp:Transcript_8002/g.23636  ORF Transcript_8002/g.23636 Transcript_8002/m.23636 type:complete len:204 (+) Transcript_8002:2450-3061(+)